MESGRPEPVSGVGQPDHFRSAAVMGDVFQVIRLEIGRNVRVGPDRHLNSGDHIAPREGVRLLRGKTLLDQELLHLVHIHEGIGDIRDRTDMLRGSFGIIAGILKIHPLIVHAPVGKGVGIAAVRKIVVAVVVFVEPVGAPFGLRAGNVYEREDGEVRRLVFPPACGEVLAHLI